MSLLVDIDDTLISTRKRTQGLWRHVLGCDVSEEEIETLTAQQIFGRHATEEQRPRMRELQRLFTETMLCRNEEGLMLVEADEPIPYAAQVLRDWEGPVVYITGRLEHIREATFSQLRRFGFPVEGAELHMFREEDWKGGGLGDARRRILEAILEKHRVMRVVDDFPGYFTVYAELGIPERIGLRSSSAHKPEDYMSRGATRVVEGWRELVT
ncbi:MAG: hypothetical protein ABIJ47_07010 [Candidatus Bathyarchaeota archaeon]